MTTINFNSRINKNVSDLLAMQLCFDTHPSTECSSRSNW